VACNSTTQTEGIFVFAQQQWLCAAVLRYAFFVYLVTYCLS